MKIPFSNRLHKHEAAAEGLGGGLELKYEPPKDNPRAHVGRDSGRGQ